MKLHPLCNSGTIPRKTHPSIMAIPNWDKKLAWPWAKASRLRRKMLKRALHLGLPQPLNIKTNNWTEEQHIVNAAKSNMATMCATTFGTLPKWDFIQNRHDWSTQTGNEFEENYELLQFARKVTGNS